MSRFLEENAQLPSALLELIRFYSVEGRELLEQWRALAAGKREILFCGMGTSEITAHAVHWRLSRLGVTCRSVDAGEWLHYGADLAEKGRVVVLTSQSGESVEMRNLLGSSRGGFVAVSNDLASTLCERAALALPMCAGEEQSITTKTYVNNLALLYLMVAVAEGKAALRRTLEGLEAVAACMELSRTAEVEAAAQNLMPGDALAFVARGPAIVSARQCALTFMEGARCLTCAFTGGAFNHGPFESVDEGLRIVVFRPRGATADLIDGAVANAVRLGARVVVLSDEGERPAAGALVVPVGRSASQASEEMFPLCAAPAHNLLLHALARAKGIEAGVFRYGSKVTSRE